jgi:hypothetical protein
MTNAPSEFYRAVIETLEQVADGEVEPSVARAFVEHALDVDEILKQNDVADFTETRSQYRSGQAEHDLRTDGLAHEGITAKLLKKYAKPLSWDETEQELDNLGNPSVRDVTRNVTRMILYSRRMIRPGEVVHRLLDGTSAWMSSPVQKVEVGLAKTYYPDAVKEADRVRVIEKELGMAA